MACLLMSVVETIRFLKGIELLGKKIDYSNSKSGKDGVTIVIFSTSDACLDYLVISSLVCFLAAVGRQMHSKCM
jgi:hypothetical protein